MASVLEEARSALRAFLRSASFNRTLVRRFVAMLASGKVYYGVSWSVISRAGACIVANVRGVGLLMALVRVAGESTGFAPLRGRPRPGSRSEVLGWMPVYI